MGILVHEVKRTSNYLNTRSPSPRNIILKLSEVNEKYRNLKAAREKRIVTYKGSLIRLLVNFSAKTLLRVE